MKILVLNKEIPFPPIGGGLLRTFHFLRALARDHDVTLLAFTYGDTREQPPFPLRVVEIPWEKPRWYEALDSGDPELTRRAKTILGQEIDLPWYASYFSSEKMSEAVTLLARQAFDFALIEDSDLGQYLPLLPDHLRTIVDFHNVYSLIKQRAIEGAGDPETERREFERVCRFEKQVAARTSLCTVCSDSEADAARELLGIEHVAVIPNGVDTSFFTPSTGQPEPGNILFTGTMSYPPNVSAVEFFAREIFPSVHSWMPHAHFHIVGAKPDTLVLDLASDSITVHGQVPDMRPYFKKAEVFVAPILSGGGTRLKLLEAAASGKAIVSTAMGAEGLAFRDREHLLIADSSAAFAPAILELLRDENLRNQLGSKAREAALAYDWSLLGERLRQHVQAVAGPGDAKEERAG